MNSLRCQFYDPKFQFEYSCEGYVKMKLLDNHQIEQLTSIFYAYFTESSMPAVFNTVATADTAMISTLNNLIKNICLPFISGKIADFQWIGSIFIAKKSGDDSYLNYHLDPTMSKEKQTNIAIWIPLCDIDENSGRMCLIPATRGIIPYYTPSIPYPFETIENWISGEAVCINMKAGEALFFDNRILHCTQKNTSGKTRIAVIIKLIDQCAKLVTPYYMPDNAEGEKVLLYEHTENIFESDKFRLPTPPASSKFIGYVNDLPRQVSLEEYNDAKQQLRTGK